MRKTILSVLFFMMVVFCAVVLWLTLLPARRPNVSITFLGYTNDATGTRVARIAITNLNGSTVFACNPWVEISAPVEPGTLASNSSGVDLHWHSMLRAGASTNITFPAPTNQSRWRLSLLVYPDVEAPQVVKRKLHEAFLKVGLRTAYGQTMPFQIDGVWIYDQK